MPGYPYPDSVTYPDRNREYQLEWNTREVVGESWPSYQFSYPTTTTARQITKARRRRGREGTTSRCGSTSSSSRSGRSCRCARGCMRPGAQRPLAAARRRRAFASASMPSASMSVVTDHDGNLVTDLTADDFEVRQDGKVQPITLAQYVAGRGAAAAAGWPRRASPRRPPAPVAGTRRARTRQGAADDRAGRRRPRHRVGEHGADAEGAAPVRRRARRSPAIWSRWCKTSVNVGVAAATDDRPAAAATRRSTRCEWNGFSRREIASFRPLNAWLLPTAARRRLAPTSGSRSRPARHRADSTALREDMSAAGTLGMLQLAVARRARSARTQGRRAHLRGIPDHRARSQTAPMPAGASGPRPAAIAWSTSRMRTGVVIYALDPRGLVAGGTDGRRQHDVH